MLPASFLFIKAYYEKNGSNIEKLNWVVPQIHWTEESLWEQLLENPPSVWGFGGYIWNINLCYRMAKKIKETFPECIIVAGGPQPEYKHDTEYFAKHPYIDIVVPADGEIPFTDIVDEYITGQDYSKCREIVLPTPSLDGWYKTEPTYHIVKDWEWPPNFVESQSHLITEMMSEFQADFKEKEIYFLYESMKGCPYKCVFCDWGGGIHTKVRIKDIDTVKQELTAVSDLKIHQLGFSDANFGILERDVEVAEHIAKLNRETGYPSTVFFHPAKNNKERVNTINKIFFDAGLLRAHHVDLQDFNPQILKNIQRIEIPWEKHIKLIYDFTQATGTKTVYVNTLLGLPGQTMDTLISDVDNFCKHNIRYSRYNKWLMLPNSPAADPKYIDEFKVKTKKTYMAPFPAGKKADASRFFGEAQVAPKTDQQDSHTDIIVSTSSFTEKEYVEMCMFTGLVYGCETLGLLSSITHGMYHLKGIPYSNFYRRMYYEFMPLMTGTLQRTFTHLRDQLNRNITDEEFLLGIENPEFGDEFPFYMLPEIYAMSAVAYNSPDLYDQLYNWLEPELDEQMKDLFKYNRNIFLSPDYSPADGRTWENDYDWEEWFSSNISGIVLEKVTVLPLKQKTRYTATDTTTSYDQTVSTLPIEWHLQDSPLEHLMDYFYKVCYGTKNAKVLEKIEKCPM